MKNGLLLSFRGAAGDEESRTALKTLRARLLAEFILSTQSEILRCAQDDSEGLGMTVRIRFSHRLQGRGLRVIPVPLAIWLLCALTACNCSLVRAQSKAPYGPSPVIQGAEWDFKHLIRLANTKGKGGSDLWPTTWAADGNIYTGWGDGGGFSGASDNTGRVSLGFARILGLPPQVQGVDVWGYYPKYAQHPATGARHRSWN